MTEDEKILKELERQILTCDRVIENYKEKRLYLIRERNMYNPFYNPSEDEDGV